MIRKAAARFAETVLDDEIVLMNLDTGSFFALKGTGLAIWNLIDGTRDEAAICELLTGQFDVASDQCLADVGRFVDQMSAAGFVQQATG